MRKNKKYYIRRTHRILGVFIGFQFFFWTISGLYFSWSDIDEIHGDHFHKEEMKHTASNLKPIGEVTGETPIEKLEIQFINHQPYYLVNEKDLFHAQTGEKKSEITKEDAIITARMHIKDEFKIKDATLLTEVGNHHEYRGRPLPVWAVQFENPKHLIAYISAQDGSFQRIRHRAWRWFDFLWMFHTMDYQGRDDFNNLLLRAFSLFGLLTIMSGFVLYFDTSKTFKKLF